MLEENVAQLLLTAIANHHSTWQTTGRLEILGMIQCGWENCWSTLLCNQAVVQTCLRKEKLHGVIVFPDRWQFPVIHVHVN